MTCFYMLNDIFCTLESTSTRTDCVDIKNTKSAADTPDFLDSFSLSIATEQIIESAMKHLNIFGKRLERAKTLISESDYTETISANQAVDIMLYNNMGFASQNELIQDMLKLGNDIRDMKERIMFSRDWQRHISLNHTSQILKNNILDTSLDIAKQGFEAARLLKKSYDIFEKDLMIRFPILSSELSVYEKDISNSKFLTETDSDSNIFSMSSHTNASSVSTLTTIDHYKSNDELILESAMLNTEISSELISNFCHPLNFNVFLENDIQSSFLNMTNSDIKSINKYFSCMEPELVERLFEAMKKLTIDPLSNNNAHTTDKSYNNKRKIEAALKILEDE
ncbi:hypothetical protein PMAC_002120 [Pneumocystis sp. 'macacae']|nr:hypothetical protein PMAC_002120 [Pneumocystis sp. 'macacae']